MSWAVSDGTFHTQVGSFPRAPLPSWASALSSQAHDLAQIHSHGNVPSGSSSRVDGVPRALHGAHHAEHLEGVSGRSTCHAPADQGDRLLFFKPDLSQSTRSSTGALPSLVLPAPRPPPTPPWPAAAPSAPPSITVLGLCFRKFPAAMNLSLLRVQSITVLCQRKRLLPGS